VPHSSKYAHFTIYNILSKVHPKNSKSQFQFKWPRKLIPDLQITRGFSTAHCNTVRSQQRYVQYCWTRVRCFTQYLPSIWYPAPKPVQHRRSKHQTYFNANICYTYHILCRRIHYALYALIH
jgi:hypothetical protein